jgi:hypothetical protein
MNEIDDNVGSSSWPMDVLPIALWLDILLEYSTFEDERDFVNTCRWTKFVLSPYLTENRRFLLVNDAKTVRLLHHPLILAEQMANLHSLDLSSHATNELLRSMHTYMPMLHTLSLVGSQGVTSAGVDTLGSDPNRCRQLQVLDITLCTLIPYNVTLYLRRVLRHPNLVIRRIPQWMQGQYALPFKREPFETDGLNTYWADGTFSLSRKDCNCGFIQDLWDLGSECGQPDEKLRSYGIRLRFVNGQQVLSVPLDAYTPGVTVVPVQESHGIKHQRSIVVVQPLCQVDPLPPSIKLFKSHFWLLVGESQYFQCRQLKTRAWYVQAVEASNINAMVTRIAQTGLEQPMPPTLVVRQIEDFLAEDID